ncbi:Hsp70 family protein [Glycomyces harbinensis]|uniref:PASTA domain-containing protein n=1 Tax=Glycomyces harbinensis TaxID=58114 RepID=A0A1G6TZX3_9ACTN|nr:Hsp70 family protein [Glycomyces harbinensis]SDD34712.1 PASTA domain-containing protein [Glycomyces harbinensis]
MSTVRIDPAAAAASLADSTGSPLAPGAAFAVYRLGRSSFRAAVVRRVEDEYVILAERAEPIGGAEFDGLLLAYLSGRHPDAGVRLWARIDDPSDPADQRLRALLLDKVARAREQLSEREFTVITVPAADVKLPVTREELDASIQQLIDTTADLLEEALAEAGVAPQELAGLLLAGGAARTPLAAVALRGRFGVEPVLAAPSAPAVEEPPTEPIPTRELPTMAEETEAPAKRRRPARAVVVTAVVLVLLAAVAAFGTRLGDRGTPTGGEGAGDASAASDAPSSNDLSPSPEPSDAASEEGESASGPPSPGSGGEEPDETEQAESGDEEDEQPVTEGATTAAVPDMVGMSTAEAQEAVGDAGFAAAEQTGEWRSVLDFSHEDCEVIDQDPAAGEVVPLSSAVAVTFSYSGSESECDV